MKDVKNELLQEIFEWLILIIILAMVAVSVNQMFQLRDMKNSLSEISISVSDLRASHDALEERIQREAHVGKQGSSFTC